MKILSIGNSFSTDAQRYVNKISVLNDNPIKTVNLYIGGCPLRKHYFNLLENQTSYEFQFNGEGTGLPVTAKDVLMCDAWDVVTIQQASYSSPSWESYEPYLKEISEQVKKYAPQAKQVIHQTWAYSEDHLLVRPVAKNASEMLEGIKASYAKAKDFIGADSIIPSGELVASLIKNGITEPHRDGYHLSNGAGRLAVGLLWYCFFTGADPDVTLLPEADVPVSDEEIAIIRKSVKETLNK